MDSNYVMANGYSLENRWPDRQAVRRKQRDPLFILAATKSRR